MAETQKEKLMRILDISEKEAEDVIACDKAIDRGEKMDFDLTPEQEKIAKKMTNVGTKKPTVYNFDNKKKSKENPTKQAVIQQITDFLNENDYKNVEIINKDRQIAFKIGDNDYEITLIQKRKPKT